MTEEAQSTPRVEPLPRRWGRLLPGAALGVALMLAYQYAGGLWKLSRTTGGMDSEFSRVAKSDYLGYLIGQNLLVLAGYALLWLAGVLLIVPALSLWSRRFPTHRRGSVVIPALVMATVVHGYFVTRLAHSRPYFMSDAPSGNWYAGLLDLPPESWRPWVNQALFDWLPWVVLVSVAGWWLARLPKKPALVAFVILGLAMASSLLLPGEPKAAISGNRGGDAPLNVIIIGSDSLRGDRLGYTGYRPERDGSPDRGGVSPQIDAWVRDATRFGQCRTPIGSTMESGVSLFSSSYPHQHGIRHMFPRQDQVKEAERRIRTLPEVLRERGYDTAAAGDWCANYYHQLPLGFEDISVSSFDNFRMYVSQAVLLAHFVVPVYFDNSVGYRLFPQLGSFAQFVTPEVVTRRVEDKIARQAASNRPFFWHVFYSCNHLPYRAGTQYSRMFTDPDYRGANRDFVAFDINGFVSGTDMEDKLAALPPDEVRQIRGLYDGCTREFDDCFGRIMAALKAHGLDRNTIVVMNSDHGDDLYEPGVTLTHGLGFNGADYWTHTPLAITGPGLSSKDLPQQVRTLDLAPTVLGLLGVEKPAGWQGHDLSGWMRGTETPRDLAYYGETSFPYILFRVPGVERPAIPPMDEITTIDPAYHHHIVLREEWEQRVVDSKQRCLRTVRWKAVATPAADGGRHYGLFHLETDPDSLRNLATERPEVLVPMKAALDRWIDEGVETPIEEIFPAGETP